MKTAFIGTGYVGLVSGTCLAEIGNDITCLDQNKEKISLLEQGITPIFEDGLSDLIKSNREAGRLKFSSDVENELKTADIIFIAVGTPSAPNGEADLSYVFSAAKTIAENAKDGVVIVTKSTVPVGTGDKISELIKKNNPNLVFSVASNPEFLREGSAVKDFMNPDRILIGVSETSVFEKISTLYKKQIEQGFKIIKTDIRSAELAKYTANAYLAMRVAFINEIADLCEKSGADVKEVIRSIGVDKRIGSHFLNPGPGYGGSCFPKDTRAISNIAKNFGSDIRIIDAVIKSNDERQVRMADKIISACNGDVKGKNIAILGIAFKANTDDIRESPALKIIEILADKGAILHIYDPQGLENAKKHFKDLELDYCTLVADAILKSETAVIITEWEQFKNINYSLYKKLTTIVDLRNIIDSSKSPEKKYFGIGK